MPVDFFLDNPTLSVKAIKDWRVYWSHVQHPAVRSALARECQYLHFHKQLIERMHYTQQGMVDNPPYKSPINWTLRAGALKAAHLLLGSIAEAALRYHAERRGYPLPTQDYRKTFGKVLDAWMHGGSPHADVSGIWADLQEVRDARNNVHLFLAANDPRADYNAVLQRETLFWPAASRILSCLKALQSP